jgi:DNA-binding transcriptional regulator YdaS (Cro superfamily)
VAGELLEPVEAYAALRRAIDRAGSQAAYAREAGITPQFLCDVLQGRRELPAAVLRNLGLTRVVRYRRVGG